MLLLLSPGVPDKQVEEDKEDDAEEKKKGRNKGVNTLTPTTTIS